MAYIYSLNNSGNTNFLNGFLDDNLTGLTDLNLDSIKSALLKRYKSNRIYTFVGDILISINPFKNVPIYTKSFCTIYNEAVRNGNPTITSVPHIFNVACKCYYTMHHTKKPQVCVISGESGAGKTESAKLIVNQLINITSQPRISHYYYDLSEKILLATPILEAFGNASTLINNNSSRFGKFIELTFDESGALSGAIIAQYLLEKSRVTQQVENERNFHIFYYFMAGISPEQLQKYLLSHFKSSQLYYLSRNPLCNEYCTSQESAEQFMQVIYSMEQLRISKDDINDILQLLSVVLHLGNVTFFGEDQSQIKNKDQIEILSNLLAIDSENIVQALTISANKVRGEPILVPYNIRKAIDVRDATAKALYERAFAWIVYLINKSLRPNNESDKNQIGILDIFGFENFKNNGFEQFCINLANEQLQHYFNQYIFAMESEEYSNEGIQGIDVTFIDNSNVLNLFLNKPIGFLSLLDEQSRFPRGNDKSLLQKGREHLKTNKNFIPDNGDRLLFMIKHYAANVNYNLLGFVEINRDTLPENIIDLMQMSSSHLISRLFQTEPEQFKSFTMREPTKRGSRNSFRRGMNGSLTRRSMKRATLLTTTNNNPTPVKGRAKPTVCGHFRKSLEWLMAKLCSANPHFIRCIKPNLDKLPDNFDSEYVAEQLSYTGVLETVRLRRDGYSFRPLFSEFLEIYSSISFSFHENVQINLNSCIKVLTKANIIGYKIGHSKIFLKYFHQEELNKYLIDMHRHATNLQKTVRGKHLRKKIKDVYILAEEESQKVEKLMTYISSKTSLLTARQMSLVHDDEARRQEILLQLEVAMEPEILPQDILNAKFLQHTAIPIIGNPQDIQNFADIKNAVKLTKSCKSRTSPRKLTFSPESHLVHSLTGQANTISRVQVMPNGYVPEEQVFISVDPDELEIFGVNATQISSITNSFQTDIQKTDNDIKSKGKKNIFFKKNSKISEIPNIKSINNEYIKFNKNKASNSTTTDINDVEFDYERPMSADIFQISASPSPYKYTSETLLDVVKGRSLSYSNVLDDDLYQDIPATNQAPDDLYFKNVENIYVNTRNDKLPTRNINAQPIYSNDNSIAKTKVSNLISMYEVLQPVLPQPKFKNCVNTMAINVQSNSENKEILNQKVIQAFARDESLRRWRQSEDKQFRETSNPTKQASWFFGEISREESELMLSSSEDGSFIVRLSHNRMGYGVSIKWGEVIHHYFVEILPGGRYRLKGSTIQFRSLQDLIKYYTSNPISAKYGEKLIKPAKKSKKMKQHEETSKAKTRIVKVKSFFNFTKKKNDSH